MLISRAATLNWTMTGRTRRHFYHAAGCAALVAVRQVVVVLVRAERRDRRPALREPRLQRVAEVHVDGAAAVRDFAARGLLETAGDRVVALRAGVIVHAVAVAESAEPPELLVHRIGVVR